MATQETQGVTAVRGQGSWLTHCPDSKFTVVVQERLEHFVHVHRVECEADVEGRERSQVPATDERRRARRVSSLLKLRCKRQEFAGEQGRVAHLNSSALRYSRMISRSGWSWSSLRTRHMNSVGRVLA